MPNQLAIAYAPNLSGGQPANTSATGSFLIGNMNTRAWNMVIPQTTTNTQYFSSPITSSAYVMAIPNPLKPATGGLFAGLDQPQFFYSLINGVANLSDAAFITTCDWVLKHYTAAGAVNSASPAAPAGCSTVGNCQSAFTSAGWFQSYGFVAPA
jgi:hypothetical protein